METKPQRPAQEPKQTPENFVKDIRRNTRRIFSSEQKILIVMEALRGEDSVAAICRKHGIVESVFYKWNKQFLEAGKKRLAGDTTREATSDEVIELRKENQRLKEIVADLMLRYDILKKTDRQKVNEKEFGLVVEDKCSGAVPFFEREGGKEIKKLIENGVLPTLSVWTIDRLGRDLRDIINTIHYFNEHKVAIKFISQGLTTLNENGKENPISKMMISILGIVGEMERNQIRERQLEGIRIAKMKGVYKGRVEGSKEDVGAFLAKTKNRKALDLLKKNYKAIEISQITGLHINTITKIKKLGLVKN